jgi:hypothetical protein
MILIPHSVEKCVIVYCPAVSVPPPSHLTSYNHTKSNLYFDSSIKTVIGEPAQYKLLTFHNPTLISIFHRLGRLSKESVQARGSIAFFVTNIFFTVKGC